MKSKDLNKSFTHPPLAHVKDNQGNNGIAFPAVPVLQNKPLVRKIAEEKDEELLQAQLAIQLKGSVTATPVPRSEDDKPGEALVQGKFAIQQEKQKDELTVQGQFIVQKVPLQQQITVQRFSLPKTTWQKAEQPIQRFTPNNPIVEKKENKTGLPDNLKASVESLSGIAMDDVKVHYSSNKPASLNAHAYAQGTDIQIGPGQEKHLPHEAWHVVQQKQGRVKPTMQLKGGIAVNDDAGLENEADEMGRKASRNENYNALRLTSPYQIFPVVQRVKTLEDLNMSANYVEDAYAYAHETSVIHIGANQTGDMYHVMAALALFPDLQVYIWGVPLALSEDAAAKAGVSTAATIAEYLSAKTKVIYNRAYKPRTDDNRLNSALAYIDTLRTDGEARGFMLDVGQATSLISVALNKMGADADAIIRQGMANVKDGWAEEYQQDLQGHGFVKGVPYILVNYRNVANTPGGVHPEHDTGTTGFRQLMNLSAKTGAIPVPMGDPPIITSRGANLENYWSWNSTRGRGRNGETGLIRYLAENYNIIGAVGMRSGVLDMLTFVGIPILSIDEDPVLRPDFEEQPTWSRTNKLESAYGSSKYGTIYVNRGPGRQESPYAKGHVEGEFNEQDEGYLQEELLARHLSHDRRQVPPQNRPQHVTHPYGKMKAEQAARRVNAILNDALEKKQDQRAIERDRNILNQLNIVALAAYDQRGYIEYDNVWDEVYKNIPAAFEALDKLRMYSRY